MKVYEIRLKVELRKDIQDRDMQKEIGYMIDITLIKDSKMKEIHLGTGYKNYCFNTFFPVETDKVYKSGKAYSVLIRTVDKDIAKFFIDNLHKTRTGSIRAIESKVKQIRKGHISRLYCLTPALATVEDQYWKNVTDEDDFEERIVRNIIKKKNNLTNTKMRENDFIFSNLTTITNDTPIPVHYKNMTMLGDKLELEIDDSQRAQELAYLALGVGLGEKNARGFGFVNAIFA